MFTCFTHTEHSYTVVKMHLRLIKGFFLQNGSQKLQETQIFPKCSKHFSLNLSACCVSVQWVKKKYHSMTTCKQTKSSLHLPVRWHKQFGQIQDIQGRTCISLQSWTPECGKDWVRLKLNNLYFVSTKCFSNVFLIHVSYLIVEICAVGHRSSVFTAVAPGCVLASFHLS